MPTNEEWVSRMNGVCGCDAMAYHYILAARDCLEEAKKSPDEDALDWIILAFQALDDAEREGCPPTTELKAEIGQYATLVMLRMEP